MKILVGQYHMNSYGGTETFTYALISELVSQNHDVDFICMREGVLSERIEREFPQVSVNCGFKRSYDIALVNHNVIVDQILAMGVKTMIVQTCHGTVPDLERPNPKANKHVAISKEVQDHLKYQGFNSTIIWNGIDCNRFIPASPISVELKKVLSLTQSTLANDIINNACKILGVEFTSFDKNINPIFDIEHEINKSDLVVGIGRSAFDAMACGRAVFIFDWRHYMGNKGDGFLTMADFNQIMDKNASGRTYNVRYTPESLASEISDYYNVDLGFDNRHLAFNSLNIKTQVQKYLSL